jgi:zinc protease
VPDSPVKRKKEPVPDRFSPALVIAKDKEAPGYIVNLFYTVRETVGFVICFCKGIRTDYLQTIVSSLLNERLEEKLYESNPPFVFAESSIGITWVHNPNQLGVSLQLQRKEERIQPYWCWHRRQNGSVDSVHVF